MILQKLIHLDIKVITTTKKLTFITVNQDTIIETSILMNDEDYSAENVFDGKSVHIPNSACFNNPIAQYVYSKYLYENVKNEDGSNFFTKDVYDIIGEWQAHNFAGIVSGGVMSASVIPVMLLSYGDTIMNKLDTIHERSVHLDLGSSIQSNSDWYVKVPSQLCKWVNKVFTLNFMEW